MGRKVVGLPGLYLWWERITKSGEDKNVIAVAAKYSLPLLASGAAAGDLSLQECARELIQDTWIYINERADGACHWTGAVTEFRFFRENMRKVANNQRQKHVRRQRLRHISSPEVEIDGQTMSRVENVSVSAVSPPSDALSLSPDPETPLQFEDFKRELARANSIYPHAAELMITEASTPRDLAPYLNTNAKNAGRIRSNIRKLLRDFILSEESTPRRSKETKK